MKMDRMKKLEKAIERYVRRAGPEGLSTESIWKAMQAKGFNVGFARVYQILDRLDQQGRI
jgi:Fe2+ or Zn2+ uptake regulation protein